MNCSENIYKLLKSKNLEDVKLGILLYLEYNKKTPLKQIYEEIGGFELSNFFDIRPCPEHHIKRSKVYSIAIIGSKLSICHRTHLSSKDYVYQPGELF